MFNSYKNQKQAKKPRFVERGMYFIRKGDNQGAFVVNIKEFDTEDTKAILIMPNFEKAHILKNKVKEAFEDGVLEYVSTIPKDVYAVCLEQYKALK